MKHSSITFDKHSNDFLINGKSLLAHLQTHEGVNPNHYIPALLSQANTCKRLLGSSEPDRQEHAIALYLCSHCGGYDGSPIATTVLLKDDYVIWKNMGYYQESDDEKPYLFHKIKGYTFSLHEYQSLLEHLKIYEP